jgi:hypothetical protein
LQGHGVPCPYHRCFSHCTVVFARPNDGRNDGGFDETMDVLPIGGGLVGHGTPCPCGLRFLTIGGGLVGHGTPCPCGLRFLTIGGGLIGYGTLCPAMPLMTWRVWALPHTLQGLFEPLTPKLAGGWIVVFEVAG